ncbi:MAG: glycosyltransferase [Flavobacteriales bacterium]|nr:glycosyltransferase [Flavobacteriales bacterium]
MLSVLIPIYNFDVTELVTSLQNQATDCKIDFEILCFDDNSSETFKSKNSQIKNINRVVYKELQQNVGRSKIRNLLAKEAQYEYILFLDCDSKINSKQFIANYIKNCLPNTVVCGGRNYESSSPLQQEKHFRWWYGTNRETTTAEERTKQPYRSFMTNNFLLPKAVFLTIQLDENLIGYGHEDTLFGLELKNKAIAIKHINNPLCHIGLEDTNEFICKTKEGIKNLLKLIESKKIDKSVRLFRYYSLIKMMGLENKLYQYFIKNQKIIESQFFKEKPSLKWFDLYKLCYLISLTKE